MLNPCRHNSNVFGWESFVLPIRKILSWEETIVCSIRSTTLICLEIIANSDTETETETETDADADAAADTSIVNKSR